VNGAYHRSRRASERSIVGLAVLVGSNAGTVRTSRSTINSWPRLAGSAVCYRAYTEYVYRHRPRSRRSRAFHSMTRGVDNAKVDAAIEHYHQHHPPSVFWLTNAIWCSVGMHNSWSQAAQSRGRRHRERFRHSPSSTSVVIMEWKALRVWTDDSVTLPPFGWHERTASHFGSTSARRWSGPRRGCSTGFRLCARADRGEYIFSQKVPWHASLRRRYFARIGL